MPGRSFSSPADFNAQFSDWLTIANGRVVRTIKARPIDLLDADRAAMLPLPPVAPTVGWVNRVRLGRDYYVRVDSNDYSIHPAVIGRRIEVVADLATVTATCDGQLVACHDRSWARHQTFTDPAHADAAALLRRRRLQVPRPLGVDEVEQRDLSVYDALGEVAI